MEFPYSLPKISKSFTPQLPKNIIIQAILRKSDFVIACYKVDATAKVNIDCNKRKLHKKKRDKRKTMRNKIALNSSFFAGTLAETNIVGNTFEYNFC